MFQTTNQIVRFSTARSGYWWPTFLWIQAVRSLWEAAKLQKTLRIAHKWWGWWGGTPCHCWIKNGSFQCSIPLFGSMCSIMFYSIHPCPHHKKWLVPRSWAGPDLLGEELHSLDGLRNQAIGEKSQAPGKCRMWQKLRKYWFNSGLIVVFRAM